MLGPFFNVRLTNVNFSDSTDDMINDKANIANKSFDI